MTTKRIDGKTVELIEVHQIDFDYCGIAQYGEGACTATKGGPIQGAHFNGSSSLIRNLFGTTQQALLNESTYIFQVDRTLDGSTDRQDAILSGLLAGNHTVSLNPRASAIGAGWDIGQGICRFSGGHNQPLIPSPAMFEFDREYSAKVQTIKSGTVGVHQVLLALGFTRGCDGVHG